MLREAYRDGTAFDFVCGDQVYGACTHLRHFLEGIGQPYVLRVVKSFTLDFGPRGRFACEEAVKEFASVRWHWRAYSAGKCTKGARTYAWYWFDTASPGAGAGQGRRRPCAWWPGTGTLASSTRGSPSRLGASHHTAVYEASASSMTLSTCSIGFLMRSPERVE